MAGQLKKDVELIFRGSDRATPTIKDVRSEVASLTQAIEKQLAAAERGEGTIDDLAKAYKALQAAQGDVADITKLATAYESLGQKHAEAAEKAEQARKKEAELAAQIEAAESPTKRLLNSRDAATRQAAAAAQKEAELAAQVRAAGAAFEAAGGDLRNFEASQNAIRQAALETARALRDGAAAMDLYKSAQAQGASNRAAQDEAARFQAMAAGSGLPQAQIQFISGLENRVEALTAAIRENDAATAAWNQQLRDRATQEAQQRIAAMATSMADAETKARALQQAMEFKNQASAVAAQAADIERFAAVAETGGGAAAGFAQSIADILNPGQAAVSTLEGVNEVISNSKSVLEDSKAGLGAYNEEFNKLSQASSSIQDMAKLVEAFGAQKEAADEASKTFEDAKAKVEELAQGIQEAEQPTEKMAKEMNDAQKAMDRAGKEMQDEKTKLEALKKALEKAGIETNDLEKAQEELAKAAEEAAGAQEGLKDKTGGKGGLFGLNPQDLQNLGYQINDIFVSLASGQNPLQVLIQQGSQIGQIFPGAFSSMIRFIPGLGLLAGAFFLLYDAIKDASDAAADMKLAEKLTREIAPDKLHATTQALADISGKLRDLNIESPDLEATMRSMITSGMDAEAMAAFAETVKDMGLEGEEATTQLERMTEAFTRGREEVIEFAIETGVYTEEQLRLIESLFEQGRADEARTMAAEIYRQKQAEIAEAAKGPWSRAWDQLKGAINDVTGAIGNFLASIGQRFQNVLSRAAIGMSYLIARMRGYSHEEAGNYAVGNAPLGSASSGGSMMQTVLDQALAPARAMAEELHRNRTTTQGRRELDQQREELALLEARASGNARLVRELERRQRVQAAIQRTEALGASQREVQEAGQLAGQQYDAEQQARDRRAGAQAGRRAAAAARREAAAARARLARAEAEARQVLQMEEGIQRSLEQLDTSVARKSTETLEQRLAAIDSQYARLFRDIDQYAERTGGRGMIGDRTIEQARAHVEAQKQQLRNYETMEFHEERMTALLQQRRQRLDEIADRVARGIITPEQGLTESEAVINEIAGQVETMARDALAFAVALRTATPNPQLEAFIARMQTAVQNNTGGQNVLAMRQQRQGAIDTEMGRLNTLIGQRNALIERENLLVQLGLQTRAQAQRNIQQQYVNTSALIQDQINKVRALAAVFESDADESMRLYFQSLMANLQSLETQTEWINPRFVELKNGFDQLLTTNIIGFIDALAQSFANLATRQTSVLGFFAAVGMAFLDMIAKTLQGIAQLILQMIILDAVESVTGIPVRALLGLFGGQGPMVGMLHSGGIAGQERRSKPVNIGDMFQQFPRYHTGGIAGLMPDETMTILRKGEEVLTEADPRHRFNGGLAPEGPSTPSGIRQVLVIGDDEIAGALASSSGERVVMTHLRRNRATVKQMLEQA